MVQQRNSARLGAHPSRRAPPPDVLAWVVGAVLLLALAVTSRPAYAERDEIQVAAASGAAVLARGGARTLGMAHALGGRYGSPWRSWLAFDLGLQWERLRRVPSTDRDFAAYRSYDLSRFGATAAAMLRVGHQVIFSVGPGLGYRRGVWTGAEVVGFVPRKTRESPVHKVVVALCADAEWRIVDRYAMALWARAETPPGETDAPVDMSGGLALSMYFWPR